MDDMPDPSAAPFATLEVPLLGVPIVYHSNSQQVIAATARALAPWRALPSALIEPGPPAQVVMIVHPLGPGDPPTSPVEGFVCRAHDDTFLAASGGNILAARLSDGVATAFLTPALAADEPGLRREVVERLGYLLVSYRDRAPVAASALVRNGRPVLLAGEGAAETTLLCYACLRAGFHMLGAKRVRVSLARGLRLWGQPGNLHLPPDAARFFPELAATALRPQDGDSPGITVDLPTTAPEPLPIGQNSSDAVLVADAGQCVVCLVAQAAGQASRLEPAPTAEAAAALRTVAAPGYERLRAQIAAAAGALAARGTYRLFVGADPTAAAALLAHLTEQAGKA